MKNVLIFGNTGFVGSWLTELLLIRNYSVSGYSLQTNTNPSLHNSLNASNLIGGITKTINPGRNIKKISLVLKHAPPAKHAR